MSRTDKVEEFIWGNVDEDQFLRNVVAGEGGMDTERMLHRVQALQGELNIRLRKGVEENYPRLLEQVTAIEHLDSAHSNFQHEMDVVTEKAEQLANQIGTQLDNVRANTLAIANLTKIGRLLNDALRCEELTNSWSKETDLCKRAELIAQLNSLVKSNDKLLQLKWLQESCLFKRDEMMSHTRQELLEQLRASLRSLNAGVVRATMKALHQLIDNPNVYQKELGILIDEAVRDLDGMFLQISAQSNQEKAAKLLPQLGTKLHDQLEQFQLLGVENSQQFARHVAKVIATRVPSDAPFAMRLIPTIYHKCLISHSHDSVTNIIRDALNPLKASVLNRSLSALFSVIDETLQQDDRRDAIIVEKLNAAFRAELASVGWDKSLQQEMEVNVAKALQYLALKLEQQLQFGEETLRYIGRISKAQMQNYLLLNIAHEMARHWPAHNTPFNEVIQPALKTILDQMRATVSLVIASMHDENMLSPLPPGSNSSEYIKVDIPYITLTDDTNMDFKEICAHLKVFRQHCAQLKPLNESFEALPSFLNFCIEQFLLHISLIRPLKAESIERFVRDFEYLCKNGIQIFNCKYSKLLNSSRQIQEFLLLMPDKVTEMQQLAELIQQQKHDAPKGNSTAFAVPQWFVAHMIICSSDEELRLPHDSAGWSVSEYANWFNQHNTVERWRFLRSLLDAYKQSVVSRGGTNFVPQFPILNQLISDNLLNPTA